jgi:imidazolonepropionase-like amidohydrolase
MRKAVIAAVVLPVVLAAQDVTVIRGAVIHPVTASEIGGSSLLIQNGAIADIGPKVAVPRGARVIDAKGLHVYPGMIDSATTVGLAEVGSIRETQDTSELGDYNPQLRTLIAVNPASEHIPVARANGITSVITLPGGGVISGQAALIHLDGWTWEEMAISPSVAMHLRFPLYGGGGQRGGGGGRGGAARGSFPDARRRQQEEVAKLREFFEQARRYQKAKAAGGPGFKRDHKLDAMLPVIEGKQPVMITASRERAIKEALEFVDRERIRGILAGVRESGEVLAEIKKRNIPVILGATLALPLEEDSPYDAAFTLPAELHKQGILFAFGTFDASDSSDVRNLPYQAANASAFGLPQAEALKAVTYNAAKIWGVDDKIGSIERGKWADLIITDGDPLETRTQIREMLIRGKPVSLENKHTELYKKYINRP